MWRADDEALLERLEDEELTEQLFRHHVGSPGARFALHARASGLVASARLAPGGAEAVRVALAGDVVSLARFLERPPLAEKPPEMLHHLALYFGEVASALESIAPEAAANAWMRALAAWLALAEERIYLSHLEAAILDADRRSSSASDVAIPAERLPIELIADLGRRAELTSRDLAPAGRAALLALAWISDAVRLAGASDEASARACAAAERWKNSSLDAALAAVAEALDDANARGALVTEACTILSRVHAVWAWSGNDEAVEQFLVEKIPAAAWEMYRARQWDALRRLVEPFRPMIESLAARIENEPLGKIAYAAACAQMFVFLSDVERSTARRLELAERAVRLCPTHRNGRLVLAALLCDQAQESLRTMRLFARREALEQLELQIARAEQLYPQSSELAETKAMLDRVKRRSVSF